MQLSMMSRALTQSRVVDVSVGLHAAALILGAQASAAFPTANKVFYLPFRVFEPILVRQLYVVNGATVSGNLDLGIYTIDGRLLVNTGSTAQAGVNTTQAISVTDTWLDVAAFYFAVTLSSTVGTLTRAAGTLAQVQLLGVVTETTGSFGLPATATFAAAADAYLPNCGFIPGSVL